MLYIHTQTHITMALVIESLNHQIDKALGASSNGLSWCRKCLGSGRVNLFLSASENKRPRKMGALMHRKRDTVCCEYHFQVGSGVIISVSCYPGDSTGDDSPPGTTSSFPLPQEQLGWCPPHSRGTQAHHCHSVDGSPTALFTFCRRATPSYGQEGKPTSATVLPFPLRFSFITICGACPLNTYTVLYIVYNIIFKNKQPTILSNIV